MIASKKGQGLAFISILVLVGILYFIFKYNTDTYGFIIKAGDEQAHLIESYAEGAKAKTYVQTVARLSAFEAIWKTTRNPSGIAIANACSSNETFFANFLPIFEKYISIYESSVDLSETSLPEYKFDFKCTQGLTIEGWGYKEQCVVKSNFLYPAEPCEDQNLDKCPAVKYSNGLSGACKIVNQACVEAVQEPECDSAANENECMKISESCVWEKSYSEKIDVTSVPLTNYQFLVESDAHFIESISGKEYEVFANARETSLSPSCTLDVNPRTAPKGVPVKFNINYLDDTEPKELILNLTKAGFAKTVTWPADITQTDVSDTNFADGKQYNYSAVFDKDGSYSVALTCKDLSNNIAKDTKTFQITTS